MCAVLFSFAETEMHNTSLHGVLGLIIFWVLYSALIIKSPIFETWDGFTHIPTGNTTTYTSMHAGNLDL
jgi:formate hydrogenlyase subunit 4